MKHFQDPDPTSARRSQLSRRTFGALLAASFFSPRQSAAHASAEVEYQLPMGLPGRQPGDGCYIRHGYACENTGFNTGWWHTGENWYTDEGNSAGAMVYVVADGEVVYADADYPGRVVIIRHPDGLYSMYGHLDYDLAVGVGDVVQRGEAIGTILFRTDDRSPSHLHFEIREFLFDPVINGESPRFQFACGRNCAPGPGYWPMGDADLPADLGWLNPTHVIGRSAFGAVSSGIVPEHPFEPELPVWSSPGDRDGATQIGEIRLEPGAKWPVVNRSTGRANTHDTSALAYRLWVKIEIDDERAGWVAALSESDETVGVDGRPSAVRFNLLPASSRNHGED